MDARTFLNEVQNYIIIEWDYECENVGLYWGYNNKLVICYYPTKGKPSLAFEAIKHEGIHAAQDCKAGKDNHKLQTLYPKDQMLDAVRKYSPRAEQATDNYDHPKYSHRWYLELEAWYMEYVSNYETLQTIASVCPRIYNNNKLSYNDIKFH